MENTINIEEIMAEIKRSIKEQGLTADMLSFEDVPYEKAMDMDGGDLAECDKALGYVNSHYYIQPYKELTGNPIKVFFKKVLRKLMKFYIEPVVFEQNDFNANTTKALNYLRSASDNKGSAEELPDKDLTSRLEVLELAHKELINRLDLLERENASLREELGKQRAE